MKRTKRIVIVLAIFLLVQTAVLWQPESRQNQVAAQQPTDPRFGAVEAFWAANEAADLGVGWERILFYWNEIQPNGPGDWNTLHVLEEWLVEANARGRTVVGLLKNTPNWATDGEFASGVPRGLYRPVDDPGNLWANYVRRVASYYGPRGVHNWIVWNEPDIAPSVYGHEFGGSVEDYYRLVKVAYKVIKQVDPNATIHLGGMTYWHDPGFLRRYLQVVTADPEAAANNYFFDVISLHIYFRPETMPTIIGNAFAAQQEIGIDPLKPVWVNETNARPSMDPEWPVQVESFPVDLEQQAWFIPQAYALGFASGAARIAVYKLVDVNLPPGGESWGLIRPHDFSKRPAYFAYKTTIKYLAGFTYPVRRQREASYYIVTFNRPQGVTRVLWARAQSPVTVRVPALAESALLVNVGGEETAITAENGVYPIDLEGARCRGECTIGGPPLFLVEQGVAAETAPLAPPGQVPATATPTITATATVSATATLIPTATATAMATATATPTETPSPTATATAAGAMTPEPTTIETAVSPTATAMTLAQPASGNQDSNTDAGAQTAAKLIPADQASWWFLAAGAGLACLLFGLAWWQRQG